MSALDQAHKQLQRDFTLSTAQLHKLAASFDEDMTAGLAGEHRSLAMLPSWLSCPTGNEQGQYVALDFGGTVFRSQHGTNYQNKHRLHIPRAGRCAAA